MLCCDDQSGNIPGNTFSRAGQKVAHARFGAGALTDRAGALAVSWLRRFIVFGHSEKASTTAGNN
jgi:hypothetical protein